MRALVGLGLVAEGPACSWLADDDSDPLQTGVEALARALPPSLTTLHALRCRVGMWFAVAGVDRVRRIALGGGPSCAH